MTTREEGEERGSWARVPDGEGGHSVIYVDPARRAVIRLLDEDGEVVEGPLSPDGVAFEQAARLHWDERLMGAG